jgi:molecular chaperone GrpE (heat shock protein)
LALTEKANMPHPSQKHIASTQAFMRKLTALIGEHDIGSRALKNGDEGDEGDHDEDELTIHTSHELALAWIERSDELNARLEMQLAAARDKYHRLKADFDLIERKYSELLQLSQSAHTARGAAIESLANRDPFDGFTPQL